MPPVSWISSREALYAAVEARTRSSRVGNGSTGRLLFSSVSVQMMGKNAPVNTSRADGSGKKQSTSIPACANTHKRGSSVSVMLP